MPRELGPPIREHLELWLLLGDAFGLQFIVCSARVGRHLLDELAQVPAQRRNASFDFLDTPPWNVHHPFTSS
jgi:hypothetical protein